MSGHPDPIDPVNVAAGWVLLHGTPLTPAIWSPVVTALAGPAAAVLVPDVTPRDDGRHPQRDLATAVLAELGGRADARWHVVGHSFGGQVALEVALAAPQRIASLTLMCSRDTPFPPFAAAADALRAGAPPDVEAALRRWFAPGDAQAAPDLFDYARRCLEGADPAAWACALDGIATFDRAADVGALDLPVTLVAAEHDPVSTPAAMGELARRLPDAVLHVTAGAAHLTPFVDPKGLAHVLRVAASRSVQRRL